MLMPRHADSRFCRRGWKKGSRQFLAIPSYVRATLAKIISLSRSRGLLDGKLLCNKLLRFHEDYSPFFFSFFNFCLKCLLRNEILSLSRTAIYAAICNIFQIFP